MSCNKWENLCEHMRSLDQPQRPVLAQRLHDVGRTIGRVRPQIRGVHGHLRIKRSQLPRRTTERSPLAPGKSAIIRPGM